MLWGCGVANGTGSISQVEGRMDSMKVQQILDVNITLSVKKLKLKRGKKRGEKRMAQKSSACKTSKDEPGISQNWKTSPRKSSACKTSHESHRTGRRLQGRAVQARRARNLTELEDFSKEEQCMQDEPGISHKTGRLLQGRAVHARRARNLTELEDFSKEEQSMQDEPGISQSWKTSPRKSSACKTILESHRAGRLLQGRAEHARRARNLTELEDVSKEEQSMQDKAGIPQNWKTSPRKSRACKTSQESHRTGRLLQGRAEHARQDRNLTELEDVSKEEQSMQDEAGIPQNWKTSPRKSSACKMSQESHRTGRLLQGRAEHAR
ncbi:uncharacterized protein ACNLHF_010249 isoform 1-T2 [Anomaloglossus baeobatrachus]|uniref:uncharacterized protein LOC142292365 isoform X1 n=1 Tax=Anomaloglossus baeobatrachus TaxID=238106 RepID=UPI003F4F3F7A